MNKKHTLKCLTVFALGLLASQVPASAFYNPTQGRWLSRDPIREGGGRNLYAFVYSDPVNGVDTDGRQYHGWPGPHPIPPPGPYPGPLPWPPPPEYKPPPPPRPSQFRICQRDLIEEDCKDKCANAMGGQHRYVEYTHPGPQVGPPLIEGWGFAGITGAEKAFKPNRCVSCRRVPRDLQFGSGKGKTGFNATDEEIWDCVKNTPPAQAYDWLNYNCTHWASEATARCGLDCSQGSPYGSYYSTPQ